jgi:hypothetical protein
MKIDRAAIQAFLATNPTPGEINVILSEIGEFTKERNKKQADGQGDF